MKSGNNAGNIHVVIHLANSPLLQPAATGYANNFAHAMQIRDDITQQMRAAGIIDLLENAKFQITELAQFQVEKWNYISGKWNKVF
jgi:hypothetical protein